MPIQLLVKLKLKEKRMYKVRIEKAVVKSLEKINEPYYSKIKMSILKFVSNPHLQGYKQLKADRFLIRIADYRIIYNIFEDILSINVIDLGHRKDIYM